MVRSALCENKIDKSIVLDWNGLTFYSNISFKIMLSDTNKKKRKFIVNLILFSWEEISFSSWLIDCERRTASVREETQTIAVLSLAGNWLTAIMNKISSYLIMELEARNLGPCYLVTQGFVRNLESSFSLLVTEMETY